MPPSAQADGDTAALSLCVAILGAPRTGKSAIASSFLDSRPRSEEDDTHSDDSRLSPLHSPSLEPLRESSGSTQTPHSTTGKLIEMERGNAGADPRYLVRYYSKTTAIGPDLFKFKIWDTPSDETVQ